jgi:hypothetical protein
MKNILVLFCRLFFYPTCRFHPRGFTTKIMYFSMYLPSITLLTRRNRTHICRLRNNFFIHTTCFDLNGSSSGAFRYTSLVTELNVAL